MKPLTVIQPETPTPQTAPTDRKTADLVRDDARTAALEPAIIAAIKTVFDPEIPVNIHDLGLIYEVLVDATGVAGVRMTLTAPACPAAQWLPGQVEQKVKAVEGVTRRQSRRRLRPALDEGSHVRRGEAAARHVVERGPCQGPSRSIQAR